VQPDARMTSTLDAALALVAQSDATRAATGAEPLRTLNEWLSDPEALAPPKILLPLLVLESRVTLLSAREKAGKSTLLGQGVAALTHGGEFLGQPCKPVRVIWYAIDEAAPDAVRRLVRCGAEGDSVVIQTERPTPEHMRAHIAEFRPALVVVDTLTELLANRLQNDRDAMEWQRALGPFMAVFRETQTAAVLVHHTTKDGRDYRGSVQLGAKVDVIANLTIPGAATDPAEEDPDADPQIESRRVLTVRGRGIHSRDRLHFDGEAYQIGEGAQGLTARILRAVADGASSKNKVVARVGGRRETVTAAIDRLVSEGALMRDGDALRAPMFGGGSRSGSPPLSSRAAGTNVGTTHSATVSTAPSSPELPRKSSEPVSGRKGTTSEPAATQVVPESGEHTPANGNHLATGPGAEPFDWFSLVDAA
jgi:hypothetical protein